MGYLKSRVCCAVCAFAVAAPVWGLALDERPAESTAWGYRPAPEYAPELNPPGFTFRPQSDAASYGLQVAADAAFEDVVYEQTGLRWNAHAPAKSFGAGTYHWRFNFTDQDGETSDWSSGRAFTITGEEPELPMPRRSELVRRISEERPRLLMRADELTRLRTLSEGRLRDTWESVFTRADRLLENPPDTSEPPLYPEGVVRRSGEWREIWWGNRRHSIAVADGAATLAFVYQLTGERKYGEAARDLLLAFAEWDPKGSTQYGYNDEAAMPLLYFPSRAYDWAWDVLTEEEREKVRNVMAVRAEDAYNHLMNRNHLWRPYGSHSNRAWHFLGEVGIAFHDELDDAPEWLDFAVHVFYTCYPVWGGADGGWHEGLAYWHSYLERFMFWVLASNAAFGIDPFVKPFFSETGYFALYTAPPHAPHGAWADQGQLRSANQAAVLMRQLAAGTGNAHWQWYADEMDRDLPGTYVGFLLGAQTGQVQGQAPTDLPPSRAFKDTGVAAMNTNLLDGRDNVQVHFKSSPWGTQSHGYNANNSFLLYYNGEPLLIRSGRRDVHGSPHHREWMWETKSDNAILVNGEGQIPHTAEALGAITDFRTTAELDIVVGEAGDSYGDRLDRWTRRIFFFKPYAVLIHDLLEAPEPATFQFLLHAPAEFATADNLATLRHEGKALDIRWLHPQGLQFSQKDEFDTPLADFVTYTLDQWHLTAATTRRETRQEFVTLIVIDNASVTAQQESSDAGRRISLRTPDKSWKLHLNWDNFVVTN